jgi:anti-anti-sigma factor
LTDLEFLDSTGLSALREARKRSKENGGRLHFIPSQQPNVTRLLEITGTVEILR